MKKSSVKQKAKNRKKQNKSIPVQSELSKKYFGDIPPTPQIKIKKKP